jgi:hypothetical protein
MKGITNAPLSVGDRIMCLYMEGETSVTPGTYGEVTKITRDPFEPDSEIISVKWDNGSSLSLLTQTDAWKKIVDNQITEQKNTIESFKRNKEIFKHFDWRFFREFLVKMRDSGIVNMFGAAPLIYAGKNHIDRYYGEGREDDEKFQEFLEDAEKARNIFVSNLVSYMKSKNMDVDDMDSVNSRAREISKKLLDIYISFS